MQNTVSTVFYQIHPGTHTHTCMQIYMYTSLLMTGVYCSHRTTGLNEVLPTDVHLSMFAYTVKNQSSPAQMNKWMKEPAYRGILGTYAQTEMGHGQLGPPMPCGQQWSQGPTAVAPFELAAGAT